MLLTTPIAFFIFNRPDLTQIVFKIIAEAKPEKLFVVADGPRFSQEEEKCKASRAVIESVDWDCEVLTNYSDKNLGCGRRIASGIEWVFSKVEEAIFLEDDCLPVYSFFKYCQELLEYYRHDERIMTINGTNLQSGQRRTEYSYHFTRYNCSWGWASWRRAWKHYDYEMKSWPEFKQKGMIKRVCEDPYEQRFWIKLFDSVCGNPGGIDTWDHQWNYVCWLQNGLAIEPEVNLVSNIGLGHQDATHTTGNNPVLKHLSRTLEIKEIKHPPFVARHRGADVYIFDYVIGGKKMKKQDTLSGKLCRRFSSILMKTGVFNMSTRELIEKTLKLFLPPIMIKCLTAAQNIFRKPILEYTPDGWQTKLTNDQSRGWSVNCVVKAEIEKWDAFCRNLESNGPLGFSHEHTDMSVIRDRNFHNVHISYAYVLAMAARKKDHISVLDWGGSLGHYYQVGKAVLPGVKIDFHVKEVPLMAKAGKQLNPEVQWYDDERCLERDYDLVMMTGSIPYIEDWANTLKRIANSAKEYLFLFRFPVVEYGPTFVAIQRIYESQMLHQLLNQSELLEVVKGTGMTLIREFVVGDHPYIKNAPEQCEIRGWLFKRENHINCSKGE